MYYLFKTFDIVILLVSTWENGVKQLFRGKEGGKIYEVENSNREDSLLYRVGIFALPLVEITVLDKNGASFFMHVPHFSHGSQFKIVFF